MLDAVVILDSPSLNADVLERAFANVLPASGKVIVAENTQLATKALSKHTARQLLVVNVDAVDTVALDLVSRLKEDEVEVPLIAVAPFGDVASAANAVDAGAADFLVMGDRLEERLKTLLGKLRTLFDAIEKNQLLAQRNAQLREAIQTRFQIVGESPQVRQLVDQIRRVAGVPRPMLIIGERGTGKELVARAIHFTSAASSGPIVTVNCAAFNDALLESELFGHEKGAFTGADATRRGKFEQADGGTLFLDEIGNMSLTFQQKILRVVEYGVFTRVGGMSELKSNVRIIAATNSNLRERIQRGEFLPDLYDRLAFEVIEVPPLRDREGDVSVLAHHFANQFEREIPAYRGRHLSKAALSELKRYPFPGNIRELRNMIERAVCRDTAGAVTPGDLGLTSPNALLSRSGRFREKVDAFCGQLLEDAMREANDNQAEAARRLGLSYHQFRYYYGKFIRSK